MVLNDERMRGRKVYRSLVIIPYALPAFMTALVWRGMLNRTFGVNRWLGTRRRLAGRTSRSRGASR